MLTAYLFSDRRNTMKKTGVGPTRREQKLIEELEETQAERDKLEEKLETAKSRLRRLQVLADPEDLDLEDEEEVGEDEEEDEGEFIDEDEEEDDDE
jgi:uncharacterized protein YlxW (UPF0749 family)